ncbi:class I SAM-dependent DNA methyltransferase [Micromonospora sp. LZ34]
MTELTERHRAVYDQIAAEFEARNREVPATYRALVDDFRARVDGPVLDLGCGPGRDLAFLAERGLTGIGLDLSAGMLARARARVGAPLVQGDLLRLPFRPATLGGVWCSAALLHLPRADAPAALAGVRRLLRPGGPLLLSLKEGDGERWERRHGEAVERFFARYRQPAVGALLTGAGLAPLRWERNISPVGDTWLACLAVAAG